MKMKADSFKSSPVIEHPNPCHPEARSSPKDLPRRFRLKRHLYGSSTKNRRWLLALCPITILLAATQSLAQGCASCYTTTAAGGSQTIHALRSGILVLLVPPVLLFIGIIFVLLRWRRAKVGVISTRREMDALR